MAPEKPYQNIPGTTVFDALFSFWTASAMAIDGGISIWICT